MGNKVSRSKKDIYQQTDDFYDKANSIYDRIDVYVDPPNRVEIFPDFYNGIFLPYESDKIRSETGCNLEVTSENPGFIEFMVDQGKKGNIREKYKVNKNLPCHKCCEECGCVEKIFEARRQVIPRSLYDMISDSPTSNTYLDEINKKIYLNKKNVRQNNPTMYGGADDTESSILSSDNEDTAETIFTPTSSEMSSATASDIKENKESKKQESKKKGSNDNRKSKTVQVVEEDESDEDNDDLEIDDDENVSEDGIMLDPDYINSSEMYKIQERIYYSSDSDDDFTDKLREAMEKTANDRRSIFDTEDGYILGMNSSTDSYLKRPKNKNSKYH